MGGVGEGLKQAYIVIPRIWERQIAEGAGIGNDWQVLVSVPSYLAYVQKESGTRILTAEGCHFSAVDLFDYSKRLGPILEQMRPASAYIRVFGSTELNEDERHKLAQAAADILA
jgi:hypothetical protein